ncbi:unnamed protein product [Mytilus coruscus]|uniref:Uncharacterized protein n=1 Tax=Mytilus coruscus TaxID=42192 RepID=A0A6J8BN72_MYTCO|nr:unnamed protein product [Mytilus coruscus]
MKSSLSCRHHKRKFYKPRNSEDENLFGMNKTTYWELYGVKRFSYSGKRQLLCYENNPREKCLYEHLIQIVGTEIDIRKRQRLFIIHDRICNSSCFKNRTQISSGSLAEGLDLPGSDMDIMFVLNNYIIEITQNAKNIKNPIHSNMFATEIDIDHPGFARLRHVAAQNEVSPREECDHCPLSTCTGTQFYLPVKPFLDLVKQVFSSMNPCEHGPCTSDQDQTQLLHSAYGVNICLTPQFYGHLVIECNGLRTFLLT